jgi:2-polyprenyl-6-methoxyphenol hydroxylase-like FAD-dependent oxidoreductase
VWRFCLPETAPARRVIVVGAGIAGLATALRLSQSGWDVLVVERAPALRGGAYMLNFGGIGYDAAERLGLLPALRRLEPAPAELVYLNAHGDRVASMPAATQQALLGPRQLTLLRGDIEQVLHDALPDSVALRWTTTVDAIKQQPDAVQIQLSDGTSEHADLLVGADGLHSRTRDLVFGVNNRAELDLGHVVATYLIEQRPSPVRSGSTVSMATVGRTAAAYSTRDHRVAAFFAFRSPREGVDPSRLREVLHREFGDLPHPVPDLLTGLDSARSVFYDRIAQVQLPRWRLGRVVLVGDAAWCVSLFAGFGSSLAVGAAAALGDELDHATSDIPEALAAWEKQLRPLVERKQRQGRRARAAFVAPNTATLGAQRLLTRLAGTRAGAAVLRRTVGLAGRQS